LHKASITHSYPHCWRCRNGLIFRATKQWFCDLSQDNLKQHAIKAVDTINMVPQTSGNRLKATLEGRLEWCLSRQRVWGVPIPALQCIACDHSYTSQELVEKVAQHVEHSGIEWWDTAEISQLVSADFACPACKNKTFKKESDILDVWFDSGVSHYAVLQKNPSLAYPADIYLEGKDQHRGWFQSSLLTSVVLDGQAPMKTIMTHGFTVDEQGRKMSKSLGNVVAPQQMIDQLGTDGLRLWASSIDCQGEAVVSDILLRNVQEVFRKIRNTCRFLLSNLYDFDIERDAVAISQMLTIDRRALEKLWAVDQKIHQGYQEYDFTMVFHALGDYCAAELSSFYLDIIKDRLYVEKADGHKRRSAQTVCWYVLDAMVRWMAPIVSFTAEEISDLYQKDKKESIHLQNFAHVYGLLLQIMKIHGATDAKVFVAQQEKQWQKLLDMRSAILKAIEVEREQGRIKHSLEAQVTLHVDAAKLPLIHSFFSELKNDENFLKEFLIVSQVTFAQSAQGLHASAVDGLSVKVEHAVGEKCPRCWNWDVTTHEHKLCRRCQEILGK
jgi:isoleucyl-tRNA synthetase